MPNILVVDDDKHIMDVISFALEKAGHRFVKAGDGKEALDQFSSNEIDLVILDVGLRATAKPAEIEIEGMLSKGELSLDTDHRSANYKGTILNLTAIEFNILQTVLSRPRMAFTRDQIMTAAWPDNVHVSERTIDSHVRNLRSKLSDTGCEDAIETVHGIGFRLGSCGMSAS